MAILRIGRRARYNATEKGKAACAAARARYNASEKGKAAKSKYRAERKTSRRLSRKLKKRERERAPFVGCDGEGTTRIMPDGSRRHSYDLFRMGDRELFNGGARLTTPELLTFILDHPRKSDILVGFSFEYDITSILVDLPKDRREHLLETYQQTTPVAGQVSPPRPPGFAKRWTWVTFPGYGTFGVNWLSRNHLSVCRPHPLGATDPRYANASDRKSIRTIYDTFGFFQSSFVKALRSWEVGLSKIDQIEAMKKARDAFETITDEIRSYNSDECALLAETMEKFRSVCHEIGLPPPHTWNGAGKIANSLHNANGTARKSDIAKLVKRGVIAMAHAAYYGGRFEITRTGMICEPIFEHDINSAYPSMMRGLPCLVHGKWIKASGETLRDAPSDAIFVCPIRFTHPGGIDRKGRLLERQQFLCGFPFRSARDGRLSWPREGRGVYWSPEIRSAERLGASCAYGAGWLYEKQCECKPFAWVEKLYRQRKALGGMKGQPIKLGMNSLYGKLAQRIGEPQFANPIWAGLITAMTRATLNDAIREVGQRNVVMIATDAIYTVGRKIPGHIAPAGDGLGEWSVKELPSIFVVQPGLYWSEGKIKSRGISASVLKSERHDYTLDFEAAWKAFAADRQALKIDLLAGQFLGSDFPAVKVEFSTFVGMRLAGHWGKPELAGQWLQTDRTISFKWTGKREGHTWSPDRNHIITDPIDGDPSWVSAHYEEGGTLVTSEGWELERMLFEALPTYAPLSEAED